MRFVLVALFLLPIFQPLLGGGEASHYLWFLYVLPVGLLAFRRGPLPAVLGVLISVLLVVVGERVFGGGWFSATSWDRIGPLALAVGTTVAIVAGLGLWSRRETAALRHESYHDALTDLPNRRMFLDRLGQRIERARRRPEIPFAVLLIDLDDFQLMNDSFGHATGNEILARLGRRLEGVTRATDSLARWGSDEFAILLDEIREPEDTARVVRRVLHTLEQPIEAMERRISTTAAVGVTLGSPEVEDPEELVGQADIAMHRAKGRGKGTVEFFDEEMNRSSVRRLAIEEEIRDGLERGEFLVHFQPIVALADSRIHGFEALVRWRHPQRGLVSPGDFIAVAEDTGLIVPLGDFVLREACGTLSRWKRSYPVARDLSMSVNLSRDQLQESDLVEKAGRLCREFGVAPGDLHLEITETVLMESLRSVREQVARLRRDGFLLALDDFGTGYSSLAYLHEFPVQFLKIDRSFVAGGNGRLGSPEIVATVVALARQLDLHTVVEGVETSGQRDQVRELGCEFAQGYFFHRPLSLTEAEALLSDGESGEAARVRG